MLDLERLRRIKLSREPLGQRIVANLLLLPDYTFPRRTEIVLEGAHNLPSEGPTFLAMNHTDRYNYWPLQYRLYREGLGFTATWVKGKYYENAFIARFMEATNNIPLPSRGYVITTEFRKQHQRLPEQHEYRVLRDLVDGERGDDAAELPEGKSAAVRALVGDNVRAFLARFDALFAAMIDEVIALNRQAACELGLYVLVFPEGTRQKRIGQGHAGLAQMTQHLGATIVPIGCNGSDRLYPGNSPLSKGGRVLYRIGEPLRVDGPELAPHRVPEHVKPLSAESARYEPQYRAITDVVMARIAELVDDEYKPRTGVASDATQGSARFV